MVRSRHTPLLTARSDVGHFAGLSPIGHWSWTMNAERMLEWRPNLLTLTVANYAMALPLADDAIDSIVVHIIHLAMVRLDSGLR